MNAQSVVPSKASPGAVPCSSIIVSLFSCSSSSMHHPHYCSYLLGPHKLPLTWTFCRLGHYLLHFCCYKRLFVVTIRLTIFISFLLTTLSADHTVWYHMTRFLINTELQCSWVQIVKVKSEVLSRNLCGRTKNKPHKECKSG